MAVADHALAAGIGDDRRLQPLGQRQNFRARRHRAAADINQRRLGLGEQRRRLVDRLGVGRRRRRRSTRLGQVDRGVHRHDVERHLERHRAGPALGELTKGLVDQRAGFGRVADPRRPFGEPLEDRELVGDFVQQAETAPDQVGWDLPADAQHRRIGGVGGGERGGGIEQAGPRHHGKDAGPAGSAGIAERHIGGGLLVPRVDDADRLAGVIERDKQRVVLHPGQRKQRIDPVPGQHLDQRTAARHPCHRHQLLLRSSSASAHPRRLYHGWVAPPRDPWRRRP
jgi:hypothetical protein